VRLKTLEVVIDVSCEGSGAADLAAAVETAWEWCRPSSEAGPTRQVRVLLEADDVQRADSDQGYDLVGSDLDQVMDLLSPIITRLAIAERADDLTMFHACALGDPATGAAAVLFGPSGTGKTTMARTLGTGLAYLTDETAGVTAEHGLVPYPKPLSVLTTPGSRLKEQVSPSRLGLVPPGDTAYRLAALVELRRNPAHTGEPEVELRPVIDALPDMVSQISYAGRIPQPLQRLAAMAKAVGGVRRVTYAEAADLAVIVGCLLDRATAGDV
jgi:hypothetical protein